MAIFGNCNGLLKLSASAAIFGEHGPIVCHREHFAGSTLVHDGFDCEDHAWKHDSGGNICIVENVGWNVELLADSVATELSNKSITFAICDILNLAANTIEGDVGTADGNRLFHGLFRCVDQTNGFRISLTCNEHRGAVSMVAVEVHTDVDIDDIALL